MNWLDRTLPPELRGSGPDHARRARLLVGIAAAIFGFNAVVTLVLFAFSAEPELIRVSAAACIGCALVIPALRASGSVSFAGNLLLVDMWAMLHILSIYLTGTHDTPLAWIMFLPMLAITICDTASGIVWTVIVAIEIGFFTWLASKGGGHLVWPGQPGKLAIFALTHIALLALLVITAFLYENFKDVTLARLSASNRKLGLAHDRALEANRAKSAFVANMSHELRTPLNAVIGYSDMLAEDVEAISPAELRADLARIKSSGKHLLRLINELLDFSRLESGRVPLDLDLFAVEALTRELVQTMENEAGKNKNSLTFLGEGRDTELFRTDPTRLRQCLYNLISNACKFTRDGKVEVRLRRLRGDNAQGAELAVFEVSDNGIGMTPEQLERVFEPFVQAEESTARRYGGTGLGLSLSRRLAEALGGTLEASSEVGVGSRFVLIVPHFAPPTGELI